MNLGFLLGPAWREEQWTPAQKQTRGEGWGNKESVWQSPLPAKELRPRNLQHHLNKLTGGNSREVTVDLSWALLLLLDLPWPWPDLNASPRSTENALAWRCGLALHWGAWTWSSLCSSASLPTAGHPVVEAITSATAHLPHPSSTAAASMFFAITFATASHYSYWGTDWVLPTGVMKAP